MDFNDVFQSFRGELLPYERMAYVPRDKKQEVSDRINKFFHSNKSTLIENISNDDFRPKLTDLCDTVQILFIYDRNYLSKEVYEVINQLIASGIELKLLLETNKDIECKIQSSMELLDKDTDKDLISQLSKIHIERNAGKFKNRQELQLYFRRAYKQIENVLDTKDQRQDLEMDSVKIEIVKELLSQGEFKEALEEALQISDDELRMEAFELIREKVL